MTDNSAEREAEAILRAEAAKAQAEQCPEGEECAVHFRVDGEIFDAPSQYARLITYSGDYAVVTEDNHVFDDPKMLIKLITGQIKKGDLPARWETSIYHVGGGTLAELITAEGEVRKGSLRYAKTHDEWNYIKGVHETTVSALQSEMIDVSKPLEM